jgi:hypothetical protein
MNKIAFSFIALSILILFISGVSAGLFDNLFGKEPFTITEITEYDLTENTIYINITENLGKDQTINVSSLFKDSDLTNKIDYKNIEIYKNVTVNTYGYVNTSLGKFKKNNQTYDKIGNSEKKASLPYEHYFLEDDTEVFCDYILKDKSCISEDYGVNGTTTVEKFSKLENKKNEKYKKNSKVENRIDGISLPKNSMIQLKITYKHPISFNSNAPSDSINKYDIVVNSLDGVYSTVLDPTWWNSSWNYKQLINITENQGVSLNNYGVNVTIDTQSLISAGKMQSACQDVRFVNSTEDGVLRWKNLTACNTSSTVFQVETNITYSSVNQIYVYYGNSGISAPTYTVDFFYDSTNKRVSTPKMNVTFGTSNGNTPMSLYFKDYSLSASMGATGFNNAGTRGDQSESLSVTVVNNTDAYIRILYNYIVDWNSGSDTRAYITEDWEFYAFRPYAQITINSTYSSAGDFNRFITYGSGSTKFELF